MPASASAPRDGTPAPACPEPIRRALTAHTTLTLAYADDDGPQACAVLYAVTDDVTDDAVTDDAGTDRVPRLLFVTAATTRHGRALSRTPDTPVAFTAQRDAQEWTALTGIQGRGTCRRLTGAERAAAWRTYAARFPYVEASDKLRGAMERTDLWALRPDWLRLIDNARGFGHKEEWHAPEWPGAAGWRP